jgi:Rieske Fe-S protein
MFEPTGVPRRTVLAGCGGLCAAALGGCAAYGPAGPAAPPAPAPAPPAVPAGEVTVLAAVADVPVGGGVVLADRDVVVTQPVSGTFKAFSATCTHQGCAVSEVSNGTINCPCHGSRFAVADGSVTAGPATTPLPETTVAVQDNAVVLS